MASATAPAKPKQYEGNLYGADLVKYIQDHAVNQTLGTAYLAVASTEGGFQGAIGDKGTSFGPFQLHIGGKLPAEYASSQEKAARFANSPQGIDYALSGLNASVQKIAPGGDLNRVIGNQAIKQVVTDFERPADPNAEIAAAQANYGKLADSKSAADWTSYDVNDLGKDTGAESVANGITSAYSSITGFFGWISKGRNIQRVGEVIGGGALIFLGVVMLGKSTAVAPVKGLVK